MSIDKFLCKEFMNSELIDNHFQGILAIDCTGIVTFCNQFFLKIFALSEDDVIGKDIKAIININRSVLYKKIKRLNIEK